MFTTFITFISEDGNRVEEDTYHTRHFPVLDNLSNMGYDRVYAVTYHENGSPCSALVVDDLGRPRWAQDMETVLYVMADASYYSIPAIMVMEAMN